MYSHTIQRAISKRVVAPQPAPQQSASNSQQTDNPNEIIEKLKKNNTSLLDDINKVEIKITNEDSCDTKSISERRIEDLKIKRNKSLDSIGLKKRTMILMEDQDQSHTMCNSLNPIEKQKANNQRALSPIPETTTQQSSSMKRHPRAQTTKILKKGKS